MPSSTLTKIVTVVAVVTMVGIGVNAFAGWGRGPEGMYRGYGPGGSGYGADLSEEDYRKMEEQRKAFFEGSDKLRQELHRKNLELESEFAKETPDAAKASAIQKDISQLQADLDQKRIDHRLKMREINPKAGKGYHGRGYGRGMGGPGRGKGGYHMRGYGPGACWR